MKYILRIRLNAWMLALNLESILLIDLVQADISLYAMLHSSTDVKLEGFFGAGLLQLSSPWPPLLFTEVCLRTSLSTSRSSVIRSWFGKVLEYFLFTIFSLLFFGPWQPLWGSPICGPPLGHAWVSPGVQLLSRRELLASFLARPSSLPGLLSSARGHSYCAV